MPGRQQRRFQGSPPRRNPHPGWMEEKRDSDECFCRIIIISTFRRPSFVNSGKGRIHGETGRNTVVYIFFKYEKDWRKRGTFFGVPRMARSRGLSSFSSWFFFTSIQLLMSFSFRFISRCIIIARRHFVGACKKEENCLSGRLDVKRPKEECLRHTWVRLLVLFWAMMPQVETRSFARFQAPKP